MENVSTKQSKFKLLTGNKWELKPKINPNLSYLKRN